MGETQQQKQRWVCNNSDCNCHYKSTPRSETELKLLQNRLKRMIGQLNGIGRMLEENRYCGGYSDTDSCCRKRASVFWIHCTSKPSGDMCGGGDTKGKYRYC